MFEIQESVSNNDKLLDFIDCLQLFVRVALCRLFDSFVTSNPQVMEANAMKRNATTTTSKKETI